MIKKLLGIPALLFLVFSILLIQVIILPFGILVYPVMLSYGCWADDISGAIESTNEFIFFPIQMLKDIWK